MPHAFRKWASTHLGVSYIRHGEGARFEMIVPEGAWRKGSGT